jgi:hypothetical protein
MSRGTRAMGRSITVPVVVVGCTSDRLSGRRARIDGAGGG